MQILRPAILISILLSGAVALSQITFQKTFVYAAADVQVFDAIETSDGGYAMAGLAGTGSQEMHLTKLDGCGNVEWSKTFGASSSVQNVWIRLMETDDNHIVMLNNNGSWFSNNMNVVLVKTLLDGTVIWKKTLGGSGNDFGSGIIQSSDGNYVVVGGTNSYGSDVGSGYEDAYVMKLDPDGNVLWSKTLGNSSAYDDAYSVAEDPSDGSLVIGGRYIINGTFYSFMAKTASDGTLQWLKGYGRDNHANPGYTVMVDNAGDYLMAGSTTTLGADFTAYGDPYLIKASAATGDTLWTRVYPPSDNSFDNSSALVQDADGFYAMMVATASYSAFTVGFVPNKHGLFKIDTDGSLVDARIYNHGGSHYPYLHKNADDSFLISGFSNQYTDPCCNFQPLLIKTDNAYNSGCNETNVLNYTDEVFGIWQVADPPYVEGTGFTSNDASGEGTFSFDSINTLCSSIPASVTAAFTWDGDCPTQPVDFTDASTGPVTSWFWDFDNGMNSTAQDTSIVFGQPGSYDVSLTVGDGCSFNTVTETITLAANITADFAADADCATQPVVFTDLSAGDIISWQWYFGNGETSTAQDTSVIYNLAGDYIVTLIVSDSCWSDTLVQTITVALPFVDAGPDYEILAGDTLTIGGNPAGDPGAQFLWQPSEFLTNEINPNPHTYPLFETTTFVLNVTQSGCTASDTMIVFVVEPPVVDNDGSLFIPNVFSPNGDDWNDVFNIYGGPLLQYHITIYNRWGEIVFETNDQQEGWNGYHRGLKAPPGMYLYKFEANNDVGHYVGRNGTITLIR